MNRGMMIDCHHFQKQNCPFFYCLYLFPMIWTWSVSLEEYFCFTYLMKLKIIIITLINLMKNYSLTQFSQSMICFLLISYAYCSTVCNPIWMLSFVSFMILCFQTSQDFRLNLGLSRRLLIVHCLF